MSQDSKLSVQLLDKIGAPLMAAINEVLGSEEKDESEIAQTMAQLLSKASQMGTTLYNTLEIKEAEDQADTTRLALTALAAPFVAEFYMKRKQVPSEDNLNRMGKSFEAVISFAENFSPASDHKSRLQTIDHDSVLFDKNQPILVTMQAMVPVIDAVEEFSFGESRRKLVQKISNRLQETASKIAKKNETTDKLQELIIFKALAEIYTSCHRKETRRVSKGDDREELSLNPVWEKFEIKVSMVEAVLGFDVETSTTETVSATDQKAPETPAAPPQESAETPVATETPAPATPAAAPDAATAGPMGFFKKPENGAPAQPAAPATPASAQPATPATEPAQAATTTPAPAAEDSGDAPPSSPMGFFKPGAKKDDGTAT